MTEAELESVPLDDVEEAAEDAAAAPSGDAAPAEADAAHAATADADAGAADAATADPDPDAPPPVIGELTEPQLEALLFVAEKPLSRAEIARLAGVDRETVDERLGDLEVTLQGRGIRLALSGDRVELTTAPEAGVLIARYVGADAVRLSPAALETLAIVAYRQPITKAGIERIRGVDSDYTVRALLHRRLIAEQGRSEAPGRPILYGTGFEFLERFGITSLEDLPALDLDVAARLVDGPDGTGDAATAEAAGTGPAVAATRSGTDPSAPGAAAQDASAHDALTDDGA